MEKEHKLSIFKDIQQGPTPLLEHLLIGREPLLVGDCRIAYDNFFETALTTRLEGVRQDFEEPYICSSEHANVGIMGCYFIFN